MKKKRFIAATLLLSLVLVGNQSTHAINGSPSYDSWAKDEVEQALELGMVPVELQGEYNAPITRGEFAALVLTYLAVQYHYPTVRNVQSVFQPVPDSKTDIAEFVNDYCLYRTDRAGNPFDEDDFSPNPGTTHLGTLRFWNGFYSMDTAYPFRDVTEEHPYARYINIAYAFGLLNGRGDQIFDPNSPITRQEAAVLLKNAYTSYAELEETAENVTYADGKEIASWAEEAALWVCGSNIMQGDDMGRFLPTRSITRQEAILCFLRLYNNAPISRAKGNREPLVTMDEKLNALLVNDSHQRYLFFEAARIETEDLVVLYGRQGGRHKAGTDNNLYVLFQDGGIWDLFIDLPTDRWGNAPYEVEDMILDETGRFLQFKLTCETTLYPEDHTEIYTDEPPIWEAGSRMCTVDLSGAYPTIELVEY